MIEKSSSMIGNEEVVYKTYGGRVVQLLLYLLPLREDVPVSRSPQHPLETQQSLQLNHSLDISNHKICSINILLCLYNKL